MVGLYEEPEKPGNVIEFIKRSLGAPSDTDIDHLMSENEELKRQRAELEKQIQALNLELEEEKEKQDWAESLQINHTNKELVKSASEFAGSSNYIASAYLT